MDEMVELKGPRCSLGGHLEAFDEKAFVHCREMEIVSISNEFLCALFQTTRKFPTTDIFKRAMLS